MRARPECSAVECAVARPAPFCPRCRGTGFAIEERDGIEVAVRCSCRRAAAPEALVEAARIPPRYAHCSIEGFEVWSGDHGSRNLQVQAKRRTREFVDCYPGVERGLLFMGSVGTGKTHLAVAALAELAATKAVRGLYVNAVQLVQDLQLSFESGGPSREGILAPVTDTELLVLDELGAGRLTDWVRDLLYYVINARYMAQRVTIFTTNYVDSAWAPGEHTSYPGAVAPDGAVASPRPSPAAYSETLTDRITERLRSRLHEMADVIELLGEDYRARRVGRGGRRP